MRELMALDPRAADQVVREPAVSFTREVATGDEMHGVPCFCADVQTFDATYH